MKKILLVTILALGLEAQEIAEYLDSCNPQEYLCKSMHQKFDKAISAYRGHRLKEAIEGFEDIIVFAQKNGLEPAHFYNNLGLAYHYAKQPQKAMEYFNKNLAYEESKPKQNIETLISIYNNMGLVYQAKGEMENAIKVVKKSLELALKKGDSSQIAREYNIVGITLREGGKYDEAIENYQKAVDIKLKEIPKDYKKILLLYGDIVGSYQDKKAYDKALEVNQKALKIVEKIHDKNQILKNYLISGFLNLQKKDFDKALEFYKKAKKLAIELYGTDNPDIANQIYIKMAQCYSKKREFDKSMQFYEKALKIYQKTLPPKHPAIATTYNSLGVLYKAKGENKKALEFYNKALKLAQESFDDNHPIIKMILKNIELAKR